MIMMTESQLEEHIASNQWNFVEFKNRGSTNYNNDIGVLRILFKFDSDPDKVITLINDEKVEFWIQDNDNCCRIFNRIN